MTKGTYVAVVEFPEALPSEIGRVAEAFLDHGVEEGEQDVDSSLLDRSLAGTLGQGR
jgi:hypothetical protein